jgi:hypothetical protein
MMGGSGGSTDGTPSYGWMMGGTKAPGWMTGGSLPNEMMGSNTDPGEVMGRLFADAPGTRMSSIEATRLGNTIPTGAVVDARNKRITFSGDSANMVVLANPVSGPDETFRIAGMGEYRRGECRRWNRTRAGHHRRRINLLVDAHDDFPSGLQWVSGVVPWRPDIERYARGNDHVHCISIR